MYFAYVVVETVRMIQQAKKVREKCTISVDCSTIWDNEDMLDKSIKDYVPKDGVILKERTVSYYDGETVYDVLKRELKKRQYFNGGIIYGR